MQSFEPTMIDESLAAAVSGHHRLSRSLIVRRRFALRTSIDGIYTLDCNSDSAMTILDLVADNVHGKLSIPPSNVPRRIHVK
jgi:hypothetical protein